jgi:hypothetical protein
MTILAVLLLVALPSLNAAPPVRSIAMVGDGYVINGAPAAGIGSGDFKEVLLHPADPGLVVKVFYNKWTSSVPEKRLEVANIARLAPLNATPKLIEEGAVSMGGKPAGFLVQERVIGTTMERAMPEKLAHVRDLFKRLAAGGVELGDTKTDFKLRENIMVGRTRSGGMGAWVVDADLVDSKKSPEELKEFYDGLFARLSRR